MINMHASSLSGQTSHVVAGESLRLPVDHPIRLSGTFGELRSNHFHTGIDIKSSHGAVGDPVYAVADGFVSRIRVGAGGYGNALYIDHPNGLTSVYAHLLEFRWSLDSFVLAQQNEQQRFEVNLFPDSAQFLIKKGDEIGKIGSTGHSMGPHLHFELRNTGTETPVNPLSTHYHLSDKTPPHISGITIYHLDHNHQIYRRSDMGKNQPWKMGDTLTIDAWRVGIGLNAVDPHNNFANKNGVYKVSMILDGDTIYQSKLDSIPWDEGTYYKSYIDYAMDISSKRRIHQCFQSNAFQPSYRTKLVNHGVIKLYEKQVQKVTLIVADRSNNLASAQFWIRRKTDISEVTYPAFQFMVEPDEPYVLDTAGFQVYFPSDALFERLRGQIFISWPDSGQTVWSRIYQLHHNQTPLRNPIRITIRAHNVTPRLKDKAVILNVDTDNPKVVGQQWQGHHLTALVHEFGTYKVDIDSMPPTISVLRKSVNSHRAHFIFRIEDDLSGSGDLIYHGFVDDQWVLGRYDLKSQRVRFDIDLTPGSPGLHEFRFEVEDLSGNAKKYVSRFSN